MIVLILHITWRTEFSYLIPMATSLLIKMDYLLKNNNWYISKMCMISQARIKVVK